jgi:hypothetical protein
MILTVRIALAFAAFSAISPVLSARAAPEYAQEVAPLLTKYCTGCHNDTDREGKLSLASFDALLKGGENGAVVTPGQADASRLLRVITGAAEPKMPPVGEAGPTAEEIAVLKAWIAAGAKGPRGMGPDPALLVTPKIKLLAPPRLAINAVALSPAGDVLAIARHGAVEIQSAADGKSVHQFEGIRGSVNGVAFSHDGALLVAAAGEAGLFGEASIFRVADGKLIREFRGHTDSLYSAVLSPDGGTLATGGYDSQIVLWDVASGEPRHTLDGHNGAVFELAFRPDGQVLASASGDRTVKLWDVARGERLDTLKESQKELYSVAFSPDGKRLAAAGVDNRIRVWRITPEAREGTNLLLESKFAHETPILRLVWSADGHTIATSGEDRLVKIWNAESLAMRHTLPVQSDWASGLAIAGDGQRLFVGRIDGTVGSVELPKVAAADVQLLVPLKEVPPEVDYGPQPAHSELSTLAEVEPNDGPAAGQAIETPGRATGAIADPKDIDLFRFTAKAGDQWILETNAARSGSPLDSKLEVLDAAGEPVPRLLLRAVRDSVIEFRGMNSDQRGVRLANWEEMLLNDYVYLSGEVIKHFQQRRGPDADAQFYPENGNRITFFDTTARAHALGEPGYMVVPYAIGTELPDNGLPVFTLNYENDDDGSRKLGKDSRLTFVAPHDGEYLVRVSDVRGFGGEKHSYELTIRRPVPDFSVSIGGAGPTIGKGSGKPFTVKADRVDNYMGPIRVEISGLPAGFKVTSPLVIAEGLYEAYGAIYAAADAVEPTDEQLQQVKVTATAVVCGSERTKEVSGGLGKIKVADKPKVIAHLEIDPTRPVSTESASTEPGETAEPTPTAEFPVLTITPGGTVTARLRVERFGFDAGIPFEVANLPHGVIVDDIGLSGVLVRAKETERPIFLRAESWVGEQERLIYATAQVEGNQVTLPILFRVVK